MAESGYETKREELFTYFDRTAAETWARLTSDEKVSGIRATVRAGRNQMRATLLNWLPADLNGRQVLDAGCGTGLFAVDAARRGGSVTAIDLSPTLIGYAQDRTPRNLGQGTLSYIAGDMLKAPNGPFDFTVAMDSLIHYALNDMVAAVETLAAQTQTSLLFTFAPKTPFLGAMHSVGKLFPKGDRAPMIAPVSEHRLMKALETSSRLQNWQVGRTERISSGFYTSQAVEIVRT